MTSTSVRLAEALEALERHVTTLRDLDDNARAILEDLLTRGRELELEEHGPREGMVVLADLGVDGPPFVLELRRPGPLEPDERLEAEYLVDPDPAGGRVYTRLDGPLEVVPITRDQAADFIAAHHSRHPRRPAGWRFGAGLERGGALVGVAWAGNPTGPRQDDGRTLELQRVAVRISRNAATKLAGAIARAARALGYRRLISYTELDEAGGSLLAAGFADAGLTNGGGRDATRRRRWLLEL